MRDSNWQRWASASSSVSCASGVSSKTFLGPNWSTGPDAHGLCSAGCRCRRASSSRCLASGRSSRCLRRSFPLWSWTSPTSWTKVGLVLERSWRRWPRKWRRVCCVQVFSSASCVEGWPRKSAPTVSQSLSSARPVSSSSARPARLRCSPLRLAARLLMMEPLGLVWIQTSGPCQRGGLGSRPSNKQTHSKCQFILRGNVGPWNELEEGKRWIRTLRCSAATHWLFCWNLGNLRGWKPK